MENHEHLPSISVSIHDRLLPSLSPWVELQAPEGRQDSSGVLRELDDYLSPIRLHLGSDEHPPERAHLLDRIRVRWLDWYNNRTIFL